MTELMFSTRSLPPIPLEIYDAELALVDRLLSSQSVTVEPGTYFVQGNLPNGSSLRQSVAVTTEPAMVVELGHEPKLDRPGDWMLDTLLGDGELARQHSAAALIQYLRGPAGHWERAEDLPVPALPSSLLFLRPGIDAVALTRANGRMTVVRFPGGHSEYFRVSLRSAAGDEDLELTAHLVHGEADQLLRYLGSDLLSDAEILLRSPDLAEDLLLSKLEDPVAAAAGAFALLRMGELDRLHDWTANLANWFPWLPDGAVARAEHLARLGEHEPAAELLRGLPERGLPVLSAGLTYATDRLRTYRAYWPGDLHLQHTLETLTRYALATDFSAPVTTFVATGPDAPVPKDRHKHAGTG